jgi:hypothetical protein
MPTKSKIKKITEGKTVLQPEATAHIVSRELTLTPQQLAKLQAALDAKRPLKMNIGLHSKLWAVSPPIMARMAANGDGEEEDDEIVDEDLVPPDDGTEIPEDEEEEPVPPEIFAKSSAAFGRKLVGATIKIYAVAVFRPEFKKNSQKSSRR